jgi:O-methyltransferase involved in polyketide biosynthesis
MKVSAKKLTGVPETLLYTLYMRFRDARNPHGIIKDKRYKDLIERIDYDFSEMEKIPDGDVRGIVFRTNTIDEITRQFVERIPEGTMVSLGSGLDFRYERVDNNKIQWYDIDLPDVIEMRRQLFDETDRLHFIPASVLDFAWIDRIPRGKPILFIAEGLLVYLDPGLVQKVFVAISKIFPESEMVLDVCSPLYLEIVKIGSPNRFLSRMYTLWKWAMTDWSELEAWVPGIQVIQEIRMISELEEKDIREFAASSSSMVTDIDRQVIETWQEESEKFMRVGHIKFGSKIRKAKDTYGDIESKFSWM